MRASGTGPRRTATAQRIAATYWPLALAAASVIVLFAPSWWSMVRIWSESATYGHGFLIPPIAAYLAWRRRDRLAGIVPGFSALGVPAVMAGCAVWYVGFLVDANLLVHAALVLLVHAAVLLAGGWGLYRVLAFPLGYLLLAVPFGEGAVPFLQDVTADWTVWLLDFSGIPVHQDGWLIEIPGGAFRVAEVCAGLRYVLAAVALSLLVADVFLHRMWQYVAMALVAGLVVPVAANAVRAYGIVMLAYLSDFELAVGVDHLIYGWAFFTAISLAIVAIGAAAGRRWPPRAAPAGPSQRSAPRHGLLGVTVLLACVLTVQGAAAWRLSEIRDRSAPDSLAAPPVGAGWTATALGAWHPSFAEPDVAHAWAFARDAAPVRIDLALWVREQQGREAVSARNDISGAFDSVARTRAAVPLGDRSPELILDRLRGGGERRLIAWGYWVDGRLVMQPWKVKLLQAKVRLFGGAENTSVVVFSTPIITDRAAARDRLAAFTGAWDVIGWLKLVTGEQRVS